MPHGWAIAEFWQLMRDAIVDEDGGRLVLLAGVAPEWFRHPAGISVKNLRTHFGVFSFDYHPGRKVAMMTLTGTARPTQGYVVRLPEGPAAMVLADGRKLEPSKDVAWNLPGDTRKITIKFRSGLEIAQMPTRPAGLFR